MAKSSDDAPKEIGPSDEKGEKDAPRRARLHVLAAVGSAVVAVAAIAATTWALANRADDANAHPPNDDATSESGTPSASPTSWASYGPTLPGTPSTLPTLPSFPTPSLDDDPVPSAPLTFPTPSVPYATTTSPYTPYTPYTPSVTTPTTTAPVTTPPATSPPASTKVWPVEPRATKINGRCGTFGSLRIVKTTGVRYVLTRGDGREGKWVVQASARKGYVIAAGATKRFSGNLGKFRPCPGDPYIDGEVTPTPAGDPDTWDVTVRTVVPGKEPLELAVTYTFTTAVEVVEQMGAGWDCVEGDSITCTFDYAGRAPSPVTLRVTALEEGQPHGGVTLATDGTLWDTGVF